MGKTLRGKWHLDHLLGVGGMAAVYAASHRNGKRGAVKLLHPEIALNEEARERFTREGYVANRVQHPGAVSVLDDDATEDGLVYLVMELLEGESLDAKAQRANGRLDESLTAWVASNVLDTLAAAHEKGIVHRDIKPDNLFVTTSGAVKVLDFGIARLREAGTDKATQTGSVMGTPAFMAPEQALGEWQRVDPRTDVWAVGATMFAVLAGRPVHQAESQNKVLLSAMTKPAPPLASVAKVSQGLADIVDRALAFDRDARWPSAAAMRDALRDMARAQTGANTLMGGTTGSLSAAAQAAPSASAAPAQGAMGQAAPPSSQTPSHLSAQHVTLAHAEPARQERPAHLASTPTPQGFAPLKTFVVPPNAVSAAASPGPFSAPAAHASNPAIPVRELVQPPGTLSTMSTPALRSAPRPSNGKKVAIALGAVVLLGGITGAMVVSKMPSKSSSNAPRAASSAEASPEKSSPAKTTGTALVSAPVTTSAPAIASASGAGPAPSAPTAVASSAAAVAKPAPKPTGPIASPRPTPTPWPTPTPQPQPRPTSGAWDSRR